MLLALAKLSLLFVAPKSGLKESMVWPQGNEQSLLPLLSSGLIGGSLSCSSSSQLTQNLAMPSQITSGKVDSSVFIRTVTVPYS